MPSDPHHGADTPLPVGPGPVNRRVVLRTFVGIGVSALAVLLVAQSADIPTALGKVAVVDARSLALPALVVVVQTWVRAARWAVILSAVQPTRIGARAALWPTVAGYLGNIALPARLGEVVRIVLISRRTPVSATAGTASVLIERIVDLLALLAFAAAAYGAVGAVGWLPLGGMLALVVIFGLALRMAAWLATHIPAWVPGPASDVLTRLFEAFAATGPSPVARAWLVSLTAWMLDALVIYLSAGALGIVISPGDAILISAGGAIGAALPAAAASFGTYELGAVTAAALVGIPAAEALQVAILGHLIGVVTLLAMGAVGILVTSIPARRPVGGSAEHARHATDPGLDGRPSASETGKA